MGGGDGNESFVSRLGEQLDPTSYFMPESINPHTYINPLTDTLNEGLSNISKPLNQFGTMITPGKQWLDEQVPLLQAWNETVENRPIDAAAIAAGTIFSGGALAGAGGGAGAGLGTAGNAAANAALAGGSATGAGAATGAGLGSLGSAGTAYGSSLLGLGGTAAGANAAAVGAGGGLGGLGLAGTTAATTALTPAFGFMNGAASEGLGSYMGQLYDKAKTAKSYYDKGRQVYDALKGEDEPDLNQPMIQLQNPYQTPTDPNRYLRGY